MKPTIQDDAAGVTLYHAESLEVLRTLPDCSVDSIVTDPPAGIGFMDKEWDDFRRARNPADVGRESVHGRLSAKGPEYGRRGRGQFIAWLTEIMAECLRVAKDGAYALVWSIPRTSHWTGMAIEDADWKVVDVVAHLFGQGFPKHRSKLKPAAEFWWLAWKPAKKATPLPGLDACRIEIAPGEIGNRIDDPARVPGRPVNHMNDDGSFSKPRNYVEPTGRWPANVVLDEEAARMLDEQAGPQQSGGTPARRFAAKTKNAYGNFADQENPDGIGRSEGMVSRFFYVAKANRTERDAGCEDLEKQMLRWSSGDQSVGTFQSAGTDKTARNHHPTVKPIALMRWLARLITPPGGLVLDCFMGSGTTGVAALEEKFRFVGIELEKLVLRDRHPADHGPGRTAVYVRVNAAGFSTARCSRSYLRNEVSMRYLRWLILRAVSWCLGFPWGIAPWENVSDALLIARTAI